MIIKGIFIRTGKKFELHLISPARHKKLFRTQTDLGITNNEVANSCRRGHKKKMRKELLKIFLILCARKVCTRNKGIETSNT